MALDTSTSWAQRVKWAIMMTTLTAAQTLFPRTVFYLPSDPTHPLLQCALILAHSTLFLLTHKGPLLDPRKAHRPFVRPLTELLSLYAGVVLICTLMERSKLHADMAGDLNYSVVFLGIVSVYLVCLWRVVCPGGGRVYLFYTPLLVAGRISFGHVSSSSNFFVPLWVPIAFPVIAARVVLEDADRQIATEAAAAVVPHQQVVKK